MADQWHRVNVGATSTRERDDLERVKREAHDMLIDDVGDARTGPVRWAIYPAPVGLRVLDQIGWEDNDLRRFLRANPGGWMVVTSVPCARALPDDVGAADV